MRNMGQRAIRKSADGMIKLFHHVAVQIGHIARILERQDVTFPARQNLVSTCRSGEHHSGVLWCAAVSYDIIAALYDSRRSERGKQCRLFLLGDVMKVGQLL